MNVAIGEARERVDALAKVTGRAPYAAEHRIDGLTHAVMVLSTIARGRIAAIDAGATERVDGVLAVITHENAPRMNGAVTGRPGLDKHLLLLADDRIVFDRQPVAVVVAETLEAAREGASRLRFRYEREAPIATLDDPRACPVVPKQTAHAEPPEIVRGDASAATATAAVTFSATYTTPIENHCPMEPHASIAAWEGDRLTIYDSTQGVFEERRKLASVFGIAEDDVRVVSPYVGGGFGNKGSVWYHQCLAAAAARVVGRPVKLVLLREEMFATTGHRAHTVQTLGFGADADGRVTAFTHDVLADTSTFDTFTESSGEVTAMAYAFPNVDIRHRVVPLHIGTPTFMRAPGEATGTYVLEVAMDELAETLGIDPIELRLRNHADRDPQKDAPFSSKFLRECYARGAERIAWERRGRPRSLRDGREFVGLGMATASYPSQIFAASARVAYDPDGTVTVRSGTHDMGQGSYTALAQIAADELGIDPGRVRMELGDTTFPRAMNSGGSTTIASVGSAIALAAREVRRRIEERNGGPVDEPIVATAAYAEPERRKAYSCSSFGAQFAEVAVDPEIGRVRVKRLVGVFDVGRVINPRLTESQLVGGMTMGIGMALLEATRVDPGTARMMNANLADYLVPTNADVGRIEAEVLGFADPIVNEIGTKPVGEIGICGVPAAIANAVYNAAGRRIRDLPIRPRSFFGP